MRYIFSEEIREFIFKNYKGCGYQKMADMILEKFGSKYTSQQIKSFYKNNKLNSGLTGWFEKGCIPYSAGKKQSEFMSPESIERSSKTRFKKGNIPENYRPIGSERVNVDGYLEIKVKDPNKWMAKHRYIWEQANGEIPSDHVIIFLDRNKMNCSLDNLMCISRKVHVRMCQGKNYTEDIELTKLAISMNRLGVVAEEKKKKRGERHS